MIIHHVRDHLRIDTPAKLNLFLEVRSRRADGFHEIESLMVPISRCDTLLVSQGVAGRTRVDCGWAGGWEARRQATAAGQGSELPAGRDNLAWRAIELLRQRSGTDQGVHVRLIKRIPAAAGLGGASSDAAAAMVAVNQLWNLRLSRQELATLSAELGSDIPFFFLDRRAAVVRGRGERLEPVAWLPQMHLVVAKPPEGLSTADVYRGCQPAAEPESVTPLVDAARRGDRAAVGRGLRNRLQPAAFRLSAWLPRLRRAFERCDLLGHQMSGSGTSYFGICRHARHARRVSSQLRAHGLGDVFHAFTIGPQSGCRASQT